jgi:hypothetical protein
MTTPPEDADALFDAPAPPPTPVFPTAAPSATSADGRREPRFKVAWPARVQLPNGKVVELRVRDLSDSGVGLLTTTNIPANSVLNFAMGVPGLNEATKIVPVTGTIKTTYMVVQGPDIYCGGTWVALPQDSREMLTKWMRRLRK